MSDHCLFEAHRVDVGAPGTARRVAAGLAWDGLVTFECGPARAGVLALARRLLVPWPHRDADPDGITVICERATLADRPGYAGFGTGELEPHTELSSAPRPPCLLMLACARAASSGGASLIADGAAVHAGLTSRAPGLAAALARPGAVAFGAAAWPGAVFEPEPGGWMTIRLRLDELARFTPDACDAVPRLREVIALHVAELPLRPGQGLLIDNRRMLHGRRAFTGRRVMHRILGDPVPHMALRPGFPAAGCRRPLTLPAPPEPAARHGDAGRAGRGGDRGGCGCA